METGCQNIQLCVAILKVAFPLEVIGPMFLFPLLYITFQCAEVFLFALGFRCYQRVKPPAEGKCDSCLHVFLQQSSKGLEQMHSPHTLMFWSVENEVKLNIVSPLIQIQKNRKTRLLILKIKRRSDHESITDDIPALATGTRNRFVRRE